MLYLFLAVTFVAALPILWRPAWVHRLVRRVSKIMVPIALGGAGVRVVGRGREHIDRLARERGFILISNHCSNLDPIALMKVLGRTDLAFVAKAETLRRPLLGRLLAAVGWFAVDRDSVVALKRFQEQVEARRKRGWIPDLVIFPEGTRSDDGTLQPFRLGPFLLAVRCGLPIVPVVIRGTSPCHRKNAFAVHPGRVRVDVLPPLWPARGGGAAVGAADLVAAVAELQQRAEAIYRAVPDLNDAAADLPDAPQLVPVGAQPGHSSP